MARSYSKFRTGDAVTFTTGKHRRRNANETKTGVIVKARKQRGHYRYTVRTADGQQWTIPERMLTEAKLTPKERAKLLGEGQQWEADKVESRTKANDDAAKRMRHLFDDLKVGDIVTYMNKHGHDEARVLELLPEEGKAVITNPRYDLISVAQYLGWSGSSRLRSRRTVKVWVNRLRKGSPKHGVKLQSLFS
jgi:hypothetical protein